MGEKNPEKKGSSAGWGWRKIKDAETMHGKVEHSNVIFFGHQKFFWTQKKAPKIAQMAVFLHKNKLRHEIGGHQGYIGLAEIFNHNACFFEIYKKLCFFFGSKVSLLVDGGEREGNCESSPVWIPWMDGWMTQAQRRVGIK